MDLNIWKRSIINNKNNNQMKTTIVLVFFMLAGYLGICQSQAVMNFHNKYKDNGKYLSVKIEGGLLKMLSNVETNDEDTQEFLDAVSKIEAIDVHSINRTESDFDESDINKFKKEVRKEKYDELMIVRDGDADIDFLVKEKKGKISDLLLVVDEPDEFVIVSISGEIDLKTIAKVTENLDIKGQKHLEKIEE
jgi:hypothetical protein